MAGDLRGVFSSFARNFSANALAAHNTGYFDGEARFVPEGKPIAGMSPEEDALFTAFAENLIHYGQFNHITFDEHGNMFLTLEGADLHQASLSQTASDSFLAVSPVRDARESSPQTKQTLVIGGDISAGPYAMLPALTLGMSLGEERHLLEHDVVIALWRNRDFMEHGVESLTGDGALIQNVAAYVDLAEHRYQEGIYAPDYPYIVEGKMGEVSVGKIAFPSRKMLVPAKDSKIWEVKIQGRDEHVAPPYYGVHSGAALMSFFMRELAAMASPEFDSLFCSDAEILTAPFHVIDAKIDEEGKVCSFRFIADRQAVPDRVIHQAADRILCRSLSIKSHSIKRKEVIEVDGGYWKMQQLVRKVSATLSIEFPETDSYFQIPDMVISGDHLAISLTVGCSDNAVLKKVESLINRDKENPFVPKGEAVQRVLARPLSDKESSIRETIHFKPKERKAGAFERRSDMCREDLLKAKGIPSLRVVMPYTPRTRHFSNYFNVENNPFKDPECAASQLANVLRGFVLQPPRDLFFSSSFEETQLGGDNDIDSYPVGKNGIRQLPATSPKMMFPPR